MESRSWGVDVPGQGGDRRLDPHRVGEARAMEREEEAPAVATRLCRREGGRFQLCGLGCRAAGRADLRVCGFGACGDGTGRPRQRPDGSLQGERWRFAAWVGPLCVCKEGGGQGRAYRRRHWLS